MIPVLPTIEELQPLINRLEVNLGSILLIAIERPEQHTAISRGQHGHGLSKEGRKEPENGIQTSS